MSSQLRGSQDVEVLFVDDDVADEPGVGVDAGPDHQPSCLRLLGVYVDDHVGFAAREDLGGIAGEVGCHARLLKSRWLVGIELGNGRRAEGPACGSDRLHQRRLTGEPGGHLLLHRVNRGRRRDHP